MSQPSPPTDQSISLELIVIYAVIGIGAALVVSCIMLAACVMRQRRIANQRRLRKAQRTGTSDSRPSVDGNLEQVQESSSTGKSKKLQKKDYSSSSRNHLHSIVGDASHSEIDLVNVNAQPLQGSASGGSQHQMSRNASSTLQQSGSNQSTFVKTATGFAPPMLPNTQTPVVGTPPKIPVKPYSTAPAGQIKAQMQSYASLKLKHASQHFESEDWEDIPPPAPPPKPAAVDLSGLPQTFNDIKQAKGQAMRIMLEMNTGAGQAHVKTETVSDTTLMNNTATTNNNGLKSVNATFMEMEETYVNQDAPLSLPAYRQIQQGVDYRLSAQIAKGGTSSVFQAELIDNDLKLANPSMWGAVVKVMDDNELMQQDDIFNQEIAIMSDLSEHPNFVRLLGYSNHPKCILMPYFKFGTLKDLIFTKKNAQLVVSDEQWDLFFIRALLLDVSTALAHMHSKGISHNDIKPDNVLLDVLPNSSLICLLTDFSISSVVADDRMGVKALKRSHLVGLSVAYAAPEVVHAFFEFRKAQKKNPSLEMRPVPGPVHSRDSYSYGVMAYEIVIRKKAYQDMTRDEIRKAVLNGHRPIFPQELIDKRAYDRNWGILCNIAESCWATDVNFRLTMSDIVKRLLLINANALASYS